MEDLVTCKGAGQRESGISLVHGGRGFNETERLTGLLRDKAIELIGTSHRFGAVHPDLPGLATAIAIVLGEQIAPVMGEQEAAESLGRAMMRAVEDLHDGVADEYGYTVAELFAKRMP